MNTSGALVVGWDEGRSAMEVGLAAKEQAKNYVERPLEKAAYVAISSTFSKFRHILIEQKTMHIIGLSLSSNDI